MVEFLRKHENCVIKIAPVNSILITKSINLPLFRLIFTVLRVRCDVDIFQLTASAQSIYREVYALYYSWRPSWCSSNAILVLALTSLSCLPISFSLAFFCDRFSIREDFSILIN